MRRGRGNAAADGDNARDVPIVTAARDLAGRVCPWEGTNRRVKNNTSTNHDNYVPRERIAALWGQRMGANGGDCITETMIMYLFNNLTLFHVSIRYHLASNARSVPEPSIGMLAHDVGMRSVSLVWASLRHGRR